LPKGWEFLENLCQIDHLDTCWTHEYSGTIRSLLNMAVKFAIASLDFDLVSKILAFARENLMTLTIVTVELDLLILTESYVTITELLSAQVQVEGPRVQSVASQLCNSNLAQKQKK